jgi:hypothetical protein
MINTTRILLPLFLILATLSLRGQTRKAAADLILYNGHIYTADPQRPWAEALTIRGTRVAAVGSGDEAAGWPAPQAARTSRWTGRILLANPSAPAR